MRNRRLWRVVPPPSDFATDQDTLARVCVEKALCSVRTSATTGVSGIPSDGSYQSGKRTFSPTNTPRGPMRGIVTPLGWGWAPYSANYSPCPGSFPGLNSIVYPQVPHITAEPSTGAPSSVSGSGVEMSTCSGPTQNRPWEQTGHPRKPLDVRDFSIRSDLCCASEAMLLTWRDHRRFFACYRAEPSAVLG
jgi:hypothetical protein